MTTSSRRRPAAHWSETRLGPVLRPIQEFMHRAAAGGIVLMAATVIALLLANSPLADLYSRVLSSYITISVGPWELRENVLHWINDGLMAIFFFLIGLEIKREVLVGELSDRRVAILPVAAALGGVTIPALLYLSLTASTPGVRGWAIPMATDIAFALGILALLGNRAPFALKVFLTAVAVVDDLIAVLVIAFFYTSDINATWLALGFGVLIVLFLANLVGIRSTMVYVPLGLVLWVAFLQSGIHATIAGVLLAFTIPARNRINVAAFQHRSTQLLNRLEPRPDTRMGMLTDDREQSTILALEDACEAVQAPLQKLEHSLHTPVNFLVIPIFALANAGVGLSLAGLGGGNFSITLGIILGLFVGKPLGILAAAWLVVRLNLSSLPPGVTWLHMLGVGCLAGIGFTMALFIASLAFGEGSALLDTAKIAIFIASLLSGVLGVAILSQAKPAA